ncbi:hypothetical protein K493DRAFT_295811 [Basidiobolus meristosporus CBS 931.73]|uniref:PiggyBac transposable element-derived protein domain-containing protein n=1 Tax=Basidiobolus meristosporus CBS 931.73 TaxID=1314790 RepID=A0A1Y1Z9B4_9FUNG|nr:hypothetical protein K493DRAFT_295811 [Basidiobolus meristosporus CBS 931.73]|eukprot:ORY06858.1 hypothetical protein K493DRAFT_295811 [Basidiobolus meristosporus CBS 931.73]
MSFWIWYWGSHRLFHKADWSISRLTVMISWENACTLRIDTVSVRFQKEYDSDLGISKLASGVKRLVGHWFGTGRTVIADSWFGSPNMTMMLAELDLCFNIWIAFLGDDGEVITIQRPEVLEEYETHKSSDITANNLRDNFTSYHDVISTERWKMRLYGFIPGICEALRLGFHAVATLTIQCVKAAMPSA